LGMMEVMEVMGVALLPTRPIKAGSKTFGP